MSKGNEKKVLLFDRAKVSKSASHLVTDDPLLLALKENEVDLRNFLDVRLSCHADKEDIIQDVFIRLRTHKSLKDGLPCEPSKVKAYLMITASNLIHDKYKHRKVRENASHHLLQRQKSFIQQESPEELTEANEKLQLVMKVLDKLPSKCSQAFLLSRFHNTGYREIGRQLGISVSMVEKYIARAINALKDVICSTEKRK